MEGCTPLHIPHPLPASGDADLPAIFDTSYCAESLTIRLFLDIPFLY